MNSSLSRVTIVRNQRYEASGVKSYVSALRKWGIDPTLDGPYFHSNKLVQQGKFGSKVGGRVRIRQHVLQKRTGTGNQVTTAEVSAEDQQNDAEYLCQVSVGTPGQKLMLDFDSVSSDFWIWSTRLPQDVQSQGTQAGHNIFDPLKSSTFQESSGSTWQIPDGDFSAASGTVGTDNLTIGGLTIKNQAIELADSLSSQSIHNASDGVLGLACSNIGTVKPTAMPSPVENIVSQQDILRSAGFFTACIGNCDDTDKSNEGQGFYTFGYIDENVLKAAGVEEPSYTPVDSSEGLWMFDSARASVNGDTMERSGNKAIVDTGTALTFVDDTTCKAIYDAIPGGMYDSNQPGYVFPANTSVDQLPDVAFAVGDTVLHVPKEQLGFAEAGDGMTYGGIQSRGDQKHDILGGTFLKGIYAIFDLGNKRFGAVQREET